VEFNLKVREKDISDWIWENLSGRFYLGDWYSKTDGNSVTFSKCVAFEISGEASYFALVLDQINQYSVEVF
jgi:hypothetical protein